MKREEQVVRSLGRLLLLVAALASGVAWAHGFLVMGTLQSSPRTPQPGEPFTLRLTLMAPGGTPVEDALVLAEFRPDLAAEASAPGASTADVEGAAEDATAVQPVTAEFSETRAGTYEAQARLSEAGAWSLLLRDRTYEEEEARARLTYIVGGEGNEDKISFILPPTGTGAASPWVWLLWLVGVPLLAGSLVMFLTLRQGGGASPKGPS